MLVKILASFSIPQKKWLKATAKTQGIAVTELLRRIVGEKMGVK